MPPSSVGDGNGDDPPRRCFICLMDEADDPTTPPPSAWVNPCPCTLTAHQTCMLTWIDSRNRDASLPGKPLACPVCQAPIVVDRPWDPLVALTGAARRTISLATPWVLGGTFVGAATAGNLAHGVVSLWLLAGREATARALWSHYPPRGPQDWIPGGWWLLSTAGPLMITVQMFPSFGTTILPLWGSLTLSIRDFIHPRAKTYSWPPSPHTALVLLAYLRTSYWWFYRDYVKKWEHQLDHRALGIPPPTDDEGDDNNNNDHGRQGGDRNRRQDNREEGGQRAPRWIRILQGFLEGLDGGIRVEEPALQVQAAHEEANAEENANRNADGNAFRNAGGDADDAENVVQLDFAVHLGVGDEEENEEEEEEAHRDEGAAGGNNGEQQGRANAELALRPQADNENAAGPDGTAQEHEQDNNAGEPQPAQAAVAPAAAAPVQAANEGRNDQNFAAHGNLTPLARALASLVRRLTCAFLLPAFCFGAGEMLRFVLPKPWTTPPRPGSGIQMRGLLQEQWGRSLVGGCAFIVLRDTLSLWGKYRLVQTKDRRVIRDVDRRRRRSSE